MAAAPASGRWEVLSPAPFECFSEPVHIADNKFIFVPYKWRHVERNAKVNGIYEYDTEKEEWIASVDYRENLITSVHSATFDKKSHTLYVYNAQREIILIDLLKQTCQVYIAPINVGIYCKCVFVKGKLHVIGGDINNAHFAVNIKRHNHKYKTSANDYETVHVFDEFGDRLYAHCVIHLSSQKCLLLIGGSGETATSDRVYRYSLQNETGWQRLQCTVPQAVEDFGYALTNDEKYVIIFDAADNLLFVLNTESLQWMTSKVRLPEDCRRCHALITDKRHEAEMLVIGYVRNYWYIEKIPRDVTMLIVALYTVEYVHVFEHYGSGKQWRIPLMDILESESIAD